MALTGISGDWTGNACTAEETENKK